MRLLVVFAALLSVPVFAGQSAPVLFYTGGSNILSLSPVPAVCGWRVPLKGVSRDPTLLLQLRKSGSSSQKNIKLNVDSAKFSAEFLIKDGPGEYKFVLLGSPVAGQSAGSYDGLCFFTVSIRSNVPAWYKGLDLGPAVAARAESLAGKTVGRGECWDLAQQILDGLGADWQRPTLYGRRIDASKEEIRPGDILQMYSLQLSYSNRTETYGLPQHTAIVDKVVAPGVYEILHQNVAGKRFVLRSVFEMKRIKSGRLEISRPTAGVVYPGKSGNSERSGSR